MQDVNTSEPKSNEEAAGGASVDQLGQSQTGHSQVPGPPPRPPPPYVAESVQAQAHEEPQPPLDHGVFHDPEQESVEKEKGSLDAILNLDLDREEKVISSAPLPQAIPPPQSGSALDSATEKEGGRRAGPDIQSNGNSPSEFPSASLLHTQGPIGAARTVPSFSPAGIGQVDSEVSFNFKSLLNPGSFFLPSPRAVHFSDLSENISFSAQGGAAEIGGQGTCTMDLQKILDKDQDGQVVFGADADKAVLSADALVDIIKAISAKIPGWEFEEGADVEDGDDTILQRAKVEVDRILPKTSAKSQTFRQDLDELKVKWDSFWEASAKDVDTSIRGNDYLSQVSQLYLRLWTLHSATLILEGLSAKAHSLLGGVVQTKEVPTHRLLVYGYAGRLLMHSAKSMRMPDQQIKLEPGAEGVNPTPVDRQVAKSLQLQKDARLAMGPLIWGNQGQGSEPPKATPGVLPLARGTEYNGRYYKDGGHGGHRSRSAGRGGGDDDDLGTLCDLCRRRGHRAEDCPWIPKDGKGPYCSLCGRRGHGEWDCFKSVKARPCPKCAQFGHFPEDCPDAKLREARERRFRSPSVADHRLRLKAGMPLDSSSSSEVEEVPREDPLVVMKRQLKMRKKEATERELARVAKEETRQANMRWADLPRIRSDIIYFVSNGKHADFDSLDEAAKKKVEETMLQVYVQQMAKGPSRSEEPSVSSSLKELGVDHLTQFAGNEGKYAVKPFLSKVDEIRSFKRWSPQVAAAALGQLLVGTARDWFDNLKKDMNGQPIGYDQLKLALLKEFYRKITIVEKTQIMNSLRFDVAKHRTHLAFLTECEKKSHIIADRGYILEDGNEMISRRQAREELVLMFFVSGSAPAIRFEIEHSQSETKEEIKRAVLRQEDAIRAKESSPRAALEAGYQVHEVSKETLEHEMKELGYDQTQINAVVRKRPAGPQKGGGQPASDGIICHYCATPGHKRYDCESMKRDTLNGTLRADKCGPRQGEAPAVEALAKRAGRKPKGKEKKAARTRGRGKRRVNAVDAEASSSGESEDEEETPANPSKQVAAASGAPSPWAGWAPPPYSVVYTPGPVSQPPEPVQTAEVSRQGVIMRSPYDLL